MIRLVQLSNGKSRKVALVKEPDLLCLENYESIYELAKASVRQGQHLTSYALELARGIVLSYDDVYNARSEWHLLGPIDVPGDRTRVLVSGTGLTHLGSAKNRDAMHAAISAQEFESITDSMKMFQSGIEGGRPRDGEIGAAPEWFYKGNGGAIVAPFGPLTVPPYGEDGGEEAEIAGVYFIDENGTPFRIGFAAGNEFSDHEFERRNYLNLAGSKLRSCSVGPELVVGAKFDSITGTARIERSGKPIWEKSIATGEENMCHSLANLEHHHFKFGGHREPGMVHVHFFGAHALSVGDGIKLQDGDWMEVQFDGFGRALRNPIRFTPRTDNKLVEVEAML